MRILLVNYRYFVSGGPERYYFNVKELLEKEGHEVVPFSIKSGLNVPCDYEEYFLDSVDDEVYFSQSKKGIGMALKSFSRMFYSFEAKKKIRRLIRKENPDIVYIMQYHNKISPSIIYGARKEGLAVVHRISDFQYMCPNALFYNEIKGICEDCLKGKRLSCLRYKCVLGSSIYSGIKMLAKLMHDVMGVSRKVDAFVVPSSFTLGKLREYGISEGKLHHIPTFFNLKERDPEVEYGDFVLYVGRIERQKGLMTLIKAFEETDMSLKIIGFSNDGYDQKLKDYLSGKRHNIEFLGRKTFEEIVPWLRKCRCTVVPSEWYDNFPNAILESFAYKKPVIATNLGSLPELVKDGETGITFRLGDHNDLRTKALYMLSHEEDSKRMGHEAYKRIETKYSPDQHYKALMNLFEQTIKDKRLNK